MKKLIVILILSVTLSNLYSKGYYETWKKTELAVMGSTLAISVALSIPTYGLSMVIGVPIAFAEIIVYKLIPEKRSKKFKCK